MFCNCKKRKSGRGGGNYKLLAVLGVLCAAGLPAADSNVIRLVTDPEVSLHWRTIESADVQVSWLWPDGAVRAEVVCAGTQGTTRRVYTDTAVESDTWTCALPTAEKDEDVLAWSVTFYNSANAVVSTQTAGGIGRVRGAGGTAFCVREVSAPGWSLCSEKRPVVAVAAGTTALTAGGVSALPVELPAWAALTLAAGDTVLARTDGDGTARATVSLLPEGLTLIIR